MTNNDPTYWEEVLKGQREHDPADGIDLEQLALSLIQEVRVARNIANILYPYRPKKLIELDYDWLVK